MQSINLHLNVLMRFGNLIEHANYHMDEFGDDIWSFFQKHYGADSQKHIQSQHEEKHQKLPKNGHICHSSLAVFVLTNKLNLSLAIDFSPDKKTAFFYQILYASIQAVDIFQPPKRA